MRTLWAPRGCLPLGVHCAGRWCCQGGQHGAQTSALWAFCAPCAHLSCRAKGRRCGCGIPFYSSAFISKTQNKKAQGHTHTPKTHWITKQKVLLGHVFKKKTKTPAGYEYLTDECQNKSTYKKGKSDLQRPLTTDLTGGYLSCLLQDLIIIVTNLGLIWTTENMRKKKYYFMHMQYYAILICAVNGFHATGEKKINYNI